MWEHVTVLEENGQVATCGRLGKKFGQKLHDDADKREIAVAVEEMEMAIHDVGVDSASIIKISRFRFMKSVLLIGYENASFGSRRIGT